MLIRKEKIKFTGNAVNLKLNIDSNEGLFDYQQEIDKQINIIGGELINPAIDSEVRRFKNAQTTTLNFYFFTQTNPQGWYNKFQYAGFAPNEIYQYNPKMLNSFFIMDFYDTFDMDNQKKIFRVYLTTLIDDVNNKLPKYTIFDHPNTNHQFKNWNIPVSYVNENKDKIVTGYTKFLFYCAANGSVIPFYNFENKQLTTTEKIFFKTILDMNNRTWEIITNTPIPNVIAYQLVGSSYSDRLDQTVQKYDNLQQNYKDAVGVFDPLTGKYI